MAKRVTMTQVARRAGVSRSAVSAAFSDRATTVGLNPATREQIRKVAAELGYEPNILSRAFIKQQSFLISMISREVFFLFALDTIKGIEDVLESTDYSLLTYYHGSWANDQAKHLKKSLSRRVDGVIIVGAPEHSDGPNHQTIRELRKSDTPVIQLYRRLFPMVPVVMIDDEQAGYDGVRHLIELGHRKIAHVTIEGYQDTEFPGTEDEARRRCKGYVRAMEEAGLKPSIVTFERRIDLRPTPNDYTNECAMAAKRLRDGGFTAATAFNDYTAFGLIQNFNEMGVRVPDDISLVGYDNIEATALMRPTLTTFRPKLFDIGRIAGETMLRMLNKQPVQDAVLPPVLLVRGSTVAPAARR